jgi:methyl-accepting chemotaxis protein
MGIDWPICGGAILSDARGGPTGAWRCAIALTLVVGLCGGCGAPKKIEECNGLVGVINAGVDRIEKGSNGSSDASAAVAELRKLAESMEDIGKRSAALRLSLPELRKFSQEYQQMASEVATAARQLADAVDKVDLEAKTTAQESMDKALRREDPLVEAINKFCAEP